MGTLYGIVVYLWSIGKGSNFVVEMMVVLISVKSMREYVFGVWEIPWECAYCDGIKRGENV